MELGSVHNIIYSCTDYTSYMWKIKSYLVAVTASRNPSLRLAWARIGGEGAARNAKLLGRQERVQHLAVVEHLAMVLRLSREGARSGCQVLHRSRRRRARQMPLIRSLGS